VDSIAGYELVAGFAALGLLIGFVPLIVPRLIGPRAIGTKTQDTYECGIDTVGSAWIRFSVSFYLFALIFVAFEVDILYLFPVGLVYGSFPWRDLVEITLFLSILVLAIVYAWRKGVFAWR
jgi:NADH-quinone oxidoreductase subunit A